MCEPISASTAAYAALAASAASAVVATASAYTQSQTAKKVANRNASIAEMQAQDAQQRGEKDAIAARQKASGMEGAQRAAFAARGLDLNAGTAGDVLDQTSFFGQADQTTARNNALKESWNKRAQRDGYQADADSINPLANAGGTLLGASANVASKWYSYGGGGSGGTGYDSVAALGRRNTGIGD